MSNLTEKQKLFTNEYLIDLNATRAYKEVYKSVKKDETARANSSRLLKKPNIQAYLDTQMKEREQRTKITQDKVLKELSYIGFANATNYARVIESNGLKVVELEVTNKLPEDKQAAIASIKEGANGIEVKLHDKVKALELIGKHLGMFTDKIEHSGSINNPFEGLTTEDLKKLIKGG